MRGCDTNGPAASRTNDRYGTCCCRPPENTPYIQGIEVRLPQQQEPQVNELAGRTGRGRDEIVHGTVAQLLVRNEHVRRQVQVGIHRAPGTTRTPPGAAECAL